MGPRALGDLEGEGGEEARVVPSAAAAAAFFPASCTTGHAPGGPPFPADMRVISGEFGLLLTGHAAPSAAAALDMNPGTIGCPWGTPDVAVGAPAGLPAGPASLCALPMSSAREMKGGGVRAHVQMGEE
jgi:hypothetical protein